MLPRQVPVYLGDPCGFIDTSNFPAVPTDFIADRDVVSLWNRYEGFKDGREPLASMAYFSFTLLYESLWRR